MQINMEEGKTVLPSGEYNKDGLWKSSQLRYKELSDEELVKGFVEDHDEKAFNEIVARYEDKIFRLAWRVAHNPNDAEDVLQDVLITLVEKLNTFRGESKFSTWLYTVAAN
ncbi:MAG: RNA polymerase sigma factor, partial [Thermodesulfobacteriota bacterium]